MKSSANTQALHWKRRDFLKTATLATGAVVFGVPTLLRGSNLNSKLNIAAIGAGGQGRQRHGITAAAKTSSPCATWTASIARNSSRNIRRRSFYRDFRIMFDEIGRSIDAVTVSTPDHFHAIAESQAMRLGKHVYGQKPLTQTIYEARHLPRPGA